MNKKKAPRLLLEQETGQAKNGLTKSNCSITSEKRQTVCDLLPMGEENAISSKNLAQILGCKSVRDLQILIANERAAGNLILSTCRNGGGYFKPAAGEQGRLEIAAFISTLRARALNTLAAIKAARSALEAVDGQINFDELEGV